MTPEEFIDQEFEEDKKNWLGTINFSPDKWHKIMGAYAKQEKLKLLEDVINKMEERRVKWAKVKFDPEQALYESIMDIHERGDELEEELNIKK